LKRRRTDTAPDWLREFCRRESERTTPIPKGGTSADYRQGALTGHQLRELFAALESPSGAPPAEHHARMFNESRRWLSDQIGTAAMKPSRQQAADYLRGVLFGLTFTMPATGDADTDQLRKIFFEHIGEIETCRTQADVAKVFKQHLPQDKVKRWNTDQAAAFDNRVRTFCRRIGFQPAKRGRPTK
jgi:hypothetical protein